MAATKLKEIEVRKKSSSLIDCPDPVEFAEKYLGLKVWSRQAEFMRAIASHSKVAVRSGHKIGKSAGAAAVALWWVCTKDRATVILTSSGYRQISEILWPEIKRLHRTAKIPLGGTMLNSPDGGLTMPDGRRLFGFSTTETEKMGGYSGANLLFLVDEASGVPRTIIEAIEGNRAGGASVLLTGNPTQTSGIFWEAFTTSRQFWHTIHISSRETPNASGKGAAIPGLATKEWVDEKRAEWGTENPLYQIRVEGNFPKQAENAVISLGLVERALKDWRLPTIEDGPLEVGVDPARFGIDKSCVIARRGRYACEPFLFSSMDGPTVAGKVMETIASFVDRDAEGRWLEKPTVKVDVIGIGASVFDSLKQWKSIETIAVNASCSAGDDQHERVRDRLWFAAAEWLQGGGKLPAHEQLHAELISPTYTFTPNGKRKVEGKDELRKRLGRSPDCADALCLSVYVSSWVILPFSSEYDAPGSEAYLDEEKKLVTNLVGFS